MQGLPVSNDTRLQPQQYQPRRIKHHTIERTNIPWCEAAWPIFGFSVPEPGKPGPSSQSRPVIRVLSLAKSPQTAASQAVDQQPPRACGLLHSTATKWQLEGTESTGVLRVLFPRFHSHHRPCRTFGGAVGGATTPLGALRLGWSGPHRMGNLQGIPPFRVLFHCALPSTVAKMAQPPLSLVNN